MKIAGYEVHPAAKLFPMLDEVSLQRLAEDIRANGQKVPIVLVDGMILDGRNRLLACTKAGVEPRFVQHDGNNPWRAVWSFNRERRQIEDAVRLALIGKEMIEGSDSWEAKQAKAKQEANEKRTGRPKKGEEKSPASCEAKLSRDHGAESSKKSAARLADEIGGVSRATMERAIELQRKSPERADAVKRGDLEGNKALMEVKRQGRIEVLAEIAKGNAPLPVGQTAALYPVIYADPPWEYERPVSDSRDLDNQYPQMPIDDICALPIADIATPDAVLFLWVTPPLIPYGLRVTEAWGFNYRTQMVWVKDRIGMGFWARQQHEILFIATRGSPPTPTVDARPPSVIHAPRGAHSVKPAAFAEVIEKMFPELPKVELFCRSPRAGWSVWGNQAA